MTGTDPIGNETRQIIAWLKAQSVHPFGAPPYTTICAMIAEQLEAGEHLKPDAADLAAAEHVATRSTKQ